MPVVASADSLDVAVANFMPLSLLPCVLSFYLGRKLDVGVACGTSCNVGVAGEKGVWTSSPGWVQNPSCEATWCLVTGEVSRCISTALTPHCLLSILVSSGSSARTPSLADVHQDRIGLARKERTSPSVTWKGKPRSRKMPEPSSSPRMPSAVMPQRPTIWPLDHVGWGRARIRLLHPDRLTDFPSLLCPKGRG